jgi:hypothetical protein
MPKVVEVHCESCGTRVGLAQLSEDGSFTMSPLMWERHQCKRAGDPPRGRPDEVNDRWPISLRSL